jgi:hypothetical protein
MHFSMVERIKFRVLMAQKLWPDNAVISGRLSTPAAPCRRGKSLQVPPLSRQPTIAGGGQPQCRVRRCRRRHAGIERGVVSLDGILAIATSLHFAAKYSRLLDSLSANAYGLYLVHYNFVVWLQYVLLGTSLFAVIKAAAVFGGTLVLSWIAVLAVQRIPFGAQLIGAPRRAVAMS